MNAIKRKIFPGIYILLMSLIITLPGTKVAADDAKALYDKGTDLLQKGELSDVEDSEGAISVLGDVIDLLEAKTSLTEDEKDQLANAYNNRGLAYYNQEDYVNAELDFNKAREYNPSDTKVLNNLGLVNFAQGIYSVDGELNDAIDWYEEALSKVSEGEEEAFHADIYSNLGVCYAKKDPPDIVKAHDSYDKAIALSQQSWSDEDGIMVELVGYTEAYYNRGNLYYNENKYEKAVTDYTKTIDYYEGAEDVESDVFENAYYNRGLCYYNLGLYADAIADYSEALQRNPGYQWARYAKGFAHYMLYEDDDAITEYQYVLDSDDAEVGPYAMFGMGLVDVRQKDTFDQGMAYLEQSCNTGQCSIACETLEQGLYADPGTMLDFELPQ